MADAWSAEVAAAALVATAREDDGTHAAAFHKPGDPDDFIVVIRESYGDGYIALLDAFEDILAAALAQARAEAFAEAAELVEARGAKVTQAVERAADELDECTEQIMGAVAWRYGELASELRVKADEAATQAGEGGDRGGDSKKT